MNRLSTPPVELRAADPTLTAHDESHVLFMFDDDQRQYVAHKETHGADPLPVWPVEVVRWFAVPCPTCWPAAPSPGYRMVPVESEAIAGDRSGLMQDTDPHLAWQRGDVETMDEIAVSVARIVALPEPDDRAAFLEQGIRAVVAELRAGRDRGEEPRVKIGAAGWDLEGLLDGRPVPTDGDEPDDCGQGCTRHRTCRDTEEADRA